jgi:hypothetical protein
MAEALPIEEAAQRFAEIVESVTKRRERVTITTADGGEVVVMNTDSQEVAALTRRGRPRRRPPAEVVPRPDPANELTSTQGNVAPTMGYGL